jgi:phosphoadenosine phosphosulfate reductase
MTNDRRQRAPAAGAIALYARATHGFDGRVAHATAVLQSAALEHAGRIAQVTSLGVEGMVLTDLIVRNQLGIAVATIDTGRLHPQTSALVPEIEARYGIAVEVHRPQPQAVARFVAAHGEDAMRESLALRKTCCELRKIEPLSRLLAGRSAWVTGLRREQSHARAVVSFNERDDAGRVKFNPLADWSWADVWHYAAQHDVPYNPLHDEFMPSIGCAPCTRAIAVGADFRSGRWWWESESAKECGLHVSVHSRAAKAAAPSQREGGGRFASAQADFGNAEVKGAQAPDRSQGEAAKECGLHVRTRAGAAKTSAPEEVEAPA